MHTGLCSVGLMLVGALRVAESSSAVRRCVRITWWLNR